MVMMIMVDGQINLIIEQGTKTKPIPNGPFNLNFNYQYLKWSNFNFFFLIQLDFFIL